MGNLELVAGENDLSVTVTPVRGMFMVNLTNQTGFALSDVQLAWFPPVEGEVLTKIAPFTIPAMGECSVIVGYTCPSVGPWRLVVVFRSDDGTEDPLVCSINVVAVDAAPGCWRTAAVWHELAPYLNNIEIALPAGTSPGMALQVIGREVTAGMVNLRDDDLALAAIDPVVMVLLVLPGKVVISHALGVVVPDPAFLVKKLADAGAVDHHRACFELGAEVSKLRQFLDLNWYVDETVTIINRVHRVLGEMHAPQVLDPLIAMLDKRETLEGLTTVERQVFEQTLQKLEQLICPA